MIPQVFHPVQQFHQSLGMMQLPDTSMSHEDTYYNCWNLLNVPYSVISTMDYGCLKYQKGSYIITTVDNLQLPPDDDAEIWLYKNNPHQARPYVPTTAYQQDIWSLLNEMILYHADKEIHPQYLVNGLHQGTFLTSDQLTKWSRGWSTRHRKLAIDGHSYTRGSFLDQCGAAQQKRLCEDATGLRECFYAVHRLVCDYILVFHGHQVTHREVEAEYEGLRYDHRSVTENGIFQGFHFFSLHTRLLRYWFHNGLYTIKEAAAEICYGLRYRVEVTLTDDKDDSYVHWVRWAVAVMSLVEDLIDTMRLNVISDYTIEDGNRDSLLVWESMLEFMVCYTVNLRVTVRTLEPV